jgi:hypothetical protein
MIQGAQMCLPRCHDAGTHFTSLVTLTWSLAEAIAGMLGQQVMMF